LLFWVILYNVTTQRTIESLQRLDLSTASGWRRCRLDGGCWKSAFVYRTLHGVLQDVQGSGTLSCHSGNTFRPVPVYLFVLLDWN